MNHSRTASRLFRRVLHLFIGIFMMSNSFSQENYIDGYVIKIDGDTLKGYVDYRDWQINPDNISFKKELSDQKLNYTPIDIQGFGVDGEKYESAIAQTEISPSSINNITKDTELNIVIDTSFLRTIIQGEKSLYYKKTNFGNDQFYVKMDGKFELLTYKRYLVSRDGKDIAAENRKYLGQLSYYLSDVRMFRLN